MGLVLYSIIVLLCTNHHAARGATHWVVTEDGKIQSQMDSMFNLNRPYDLMAMLKQEDRARVLEDLKQELLLRKEHIDRNEDRDSGLEQRFYRSDADCIAAIKPLPEYDLYISTVLPLENKGIRPEEHIDFRAPPVTSPVPPECTRLTDLEFSMDAFEHLEGVKHRVNLTGTPELGLKNAITHRDNVNDYGHLVYEALQKNKTSWVLYNMAAFYWRIKGHPYNVVECIRRALHYSPRMYKDVALISLANVLHRARYSDEAAVVVSAALEVSKDLNVNHFTLGNIYAVLAQYNKSVISFEETLKIQPDFEAAELRRRAVLCHAKLEEALEHQHQSLQQTLSDLKDYQKKHDIWQSVQERIQAEQAPSDVKFDQRVGYESYKIRRMSQGVGEFCKMEDKDGRQILQCSWARKSDESDEKDLVGTWTQIREKPKPELSPSASGLNLPELLIYLDPVRPAKFTVKRVLSEEEEAELPYKDADWPSKEECDTFVQKFPSHNEFPTTYLPPENKGFEVKMLLSAAQDLPEGSQHSLPWYPPKCNLVTPPSGEKTFDHLGGVRDRSKLPQKVTDPAMTEVLLDLVDGDVTEEEIGQRILTALRKEIGPSWVLYNLAGLYWRSRGGTEFGIECLRHALYFVPKPYRDVPLVNLANLLYKLGRLDDSATLMREAIKVNDMEPETHFFLANVLVAQGNTTGATYHYEQALLQDADHSAAFSGLRSLKCYYKYHRTAQSAAPPPPKEAPPVSHSCSQSCTATCNHGNGNGNGGGNGKANKARPQIESRLICKNENGKENCVVETSSPNCDPGVPCTQTCYISPLSMETCEGPGGVKCLGHNHEDELPTDGTPPKCPGTTTDSCRQPSSLGPMSDTLDPNPMAAPDFYDKMEAVKEYYRHRGLCEGDDCQKYYVQCIAPTKSEGDMESFVAQHFIYQHPTQPPPMGQQCLQQPQQHRPHTKLEIQNGVLHQKLILVDSPDDIVVGPNDCVIFNDGHKTPGCQREEYRSFDFEEFSSLLSQWETPEIYSSHGNEYEESSQPTSKNIQDNESGNSNTDDLSYNTNTEDTGLRSNEMSNSKNSDPEKSTNHAAGEGTKKNSIQQTTNQRRDSDQEPANQKPHQQTANKNGVSSKQPANQKKDSDKHAANQKRDATDFEEEIIHEEDEETELEDFNWEEEEKRTHDTSQDTVTGEDQSEATMAAPPATRQLQENVIEWNDGEALSPYPDPVRHVSTVTDEPLPTWDECRQNYKEINYRQFSSTWVSVTTKNINIQDIVDFRTAVRGDLQEPVCHYASKISGSPLDALPSLQNLARADYKPEWGLRDILQKLGGDTESIGVVGTRINRAMKKDPSSWVLANLGALYWRVDGDAKRAVDCIKTAYHMAPDHSKDIALLSLVNILHYIGSLEEGIVVCDMALEANPNLVAAHFTMANLYAAREDWSRARKFYESTLGLQAAFEPARERLYSLRCQKVLSNPHIYRSAQPPTAGRGNSRTEL